MWRGGAPRDTMQCLRTGVCLLLQQAQAPEINGTSEVFKSLCKSKPQLGEARIELATVGSELTV